MRHQKRQVRYDPVRVQAWLLARGFRPVVLSGDGDPAHREWSNYQLDDPSAEGDDYAYRLRVGVKNYHDSRSDVPEPFWINTDNDRPPMRTRTLAQFKAMIVTLLLVGSEGA